MIQDRIGSTMRGISKSLAEGVGFEPTRACALPVFKTGAINHSTTPPRVLLASRELCHRSIVQQAPTELGILPVRQMGVSPVFNAKDKQQARRLLAAQARC